ncbi:MAG: VanZ family protein [Candidatus Obscuribacterales bacterium]|nr:VanZ family protein [Candidatus Obscuribacterales bacterium]
MKTLLRNPVFRWFLVLIWMLVIFLVSHQPYSGRVTEAYLGDFNVLVRKIGHIAEFYLLFVLVYWAKSARIEKNSAETAGTAETVETTGTGIDTSIRKRFSKEIFAFCFSVLYAASDEWHQSFVAGRSAAVTDVLFDATGVAAAWISVLLYKRFYR